MFCDDRKMWIKGLRKQEWKRDKMLHEKRGEEGREERRVGNVRGLEREIDKGEESEDEDANART